MQAGIGIVVLGVLAVILIFVVEDIQLANLQRVLDQMERSL